MKKPKKAILAHVLQPLFIDFNVSQYIFKRIFSFQVSIKLRLLILGGLWITGCSYNTNMPKSVTLSKNKTIIYGTLSRTKEANTTVLTIKNPKTGQVLEMNGNSKKPTPFIYEMDPGTVEIVVNRKSTGEQSYSPRTKMFFDAISPQQLDPKVKRLMYLPKGRLIYVGHWQFNPSGITVYYKKGKKVMSLKNKFENLDFVAGGESFPQ